MPNWCEGTLKIRGTMDDIIFFMDHGLNTYKLVSSYGSDDIYETSNIHYEPVDKDHWVIKKEWTNFDICKDKSIDNPDMVAMVNYTFRSNGGVYIEETDRAYIISDYISIERPENPDEKTIVVVDFEQAWGIDSYGWCKLSSKYNLDFRLFGYESGMLFSTDVEIISGKCTKNDVHRYETFEDWEWNCPFPNLGG